MVDLDAGSVDEVVRLLYQPVSPQNIPQLPSGYLAAPKAFDLSVMIGEGQTAGAYTFTKAFTITILLTAGEMALAGGAESEVVIQHYHDNRWEALTTTVDFRASIAQAQAESLSMFALTIKEAEAAPTPTPIPASFHETTKCGSSR